MTPPSDRIAVPTNGHRAPLADPPPAEAPPAESVAQDEKPIEIVDTPSVRIAVTPAQAAVGFSIVASLIVFLLGRRRGRGR